MDDGIHTLVLVRICETGASVWTCAQCEFVCIIKNDKTIAILRGDETAYHMTPDELNNIMPDHAASHEFTGTDELCEPMTFEEQMKLAHTSFYDWIVDHNDVLENL